MDRTVERLAREVASLAPARPMRLMHVCGTHENAICRHGLRALLPPGLRLVAGPGCPVCVCPASDIDLACRMAKRRGVTLCTFGDVVRVPARGTLMDARAQGGDVRVVYSISDAVDIAWASPDREVVFFAVGFETTACTTAAVLLADPPQNFSVLCSHRLIPPALEALLASGTGGLDGFLLPGHVSTVIGSRVYEALAERFQRPMVVAGFEPADIMLGLRELVHLLVRGEASVGNAYPRAVRREGNRAAREAIERVFEECDSVWRGLGTIARSGLRLREEFTRYDAIERLDLAPDPTVPDFEPGCRCGEVLMGLAEPEECPLFGAGCLPEAPVGPCMVGFEGTCHARYRHGALVGGEES